MEAFTVEAAGGPWTAVRDAGSGRWPRERLLAYARWTLHGGREPAAAAAVLAARLLVRGALVPPHPELEARAARFGARASAALRWLHRLQLAALCCGPLPARLRSDLHRLGAFSWDEAQTLCDWALADLRETLLALASLHGPAEAGDEEVFVSAAGEPHRRLRTLFVEDGWPKEAEPWRPPLEWRRAAAPPPAAAARLLSLLLRHEAPRPGQTEALGLLLAGRDCAVALPTGAGKSAVFQAAALLSGGTALVVTPLLALMRDQLARLRGAGVGRAAGLASDDPQGTRDALAALAAGRLSLCYLSPERLASARFRDALRACVEGEGVSFVAVDEAHCVSHWGHDFRPAYRLLGARVRRWAEAPGRVPALGCFSGTAEPRALERACVELGGSPALVMAPAAAPRLTFEVLRAAPGTLAARAGELALWCGAGGAGLAFCQRVEGPLGAWTVARAAREAGAECGCVTGRAPTGVAEAEWERSKAADAAAFLSGGLDLLAATGAFGLGVHRADVRRTAHLGLPSSAAELFQQAGRAGRDGRAAACRVAFELDSPARARRWLDPSLPMARLTAELEALPPARRDCVSRALVLHLGRFPGLEPELFAVDELLRRLAGGPAVLGGEDAVAWERAAARLEAAGALEVADRTAEGLIVAPARLAGARARAGALLWSVYAEAEPQARQRLGELLELCLAPDPGAALARRLAAFTLATL